MILNQEIWDVRGERMTTSSHKAENNVKSATSKKIVTNWDESKQKRKSLFSLHFRFNGLLITFSLIDPQQEYSHVSFFDLLVGTPTYDFTKSSPPLKKKPGMKSITLVYGKIILAEWKIANLESIVTIWVHPASTLHRTNGVD